MRKCNKHFLNDHSSNFILGTRVNKLNELNSDGNDQIIETRKFGHRKLGESLRKLFIYLTIRDT